MKCRQTLKRMHVDEDDKLNDKSASSLGQRGGWLIKESGLYSLILSSKDPGLKKLLYLHFTMDDNLSLDEEVKARYRSMYIGVFFKRYILGFCWMPQV